MLRTDLAKSILNGLLSLFDHEDANAQAIQFSHSHLYLGLLTKLPNNNGQAHEDGTFFSEPVNDSFYKRIKLDPYLSDTDSSYINPINNKQFLSTPIVQDTAITIGQDSYKPVYVENQGLILFQEPETTYTIVGFGLFDDDCKDENGNVKEGYNTTEAPLIWGPVKGVDEDGNETASVTVGPENIPIIRAGGFRITMQ